MQRYARDQGIAELGYLNPTFYALAAEAAPNTIFYDINRGANLGHDAGPGWDFATGLGSPRVDALTDALVAYLKRR
jgi:kumamolisin